MRLLVLGHVYTVHSVRAWPSHRPGSSAAPATGPVAPEWLAGHGVREWTGEGSQPLWISDPEWRGFGAHTGAAARAAGLTFRPVAVTLRDAAAYDEVREPTDPRRCGLSDETVRRLLTLLGH